MLYNYLIRKLPTPGTGNLAFLPAFGLPLDWFQGQGTGVQAQLNVLSDVPQVYQKHHAIVDGMQGIEAGSIGQAGLINMEDYLSSITAGAI
jgi:hypothetical protein